MVVSFDELVDDLPGLLEALEVMQVQAFLLEGADEPLRHPVAFRLSDVGGRGPDSESVQLGLELVGRVLGAPVVPESKAESDPGGVAGDMGPHALSDGLQSRPPVSLLGHVPPTTSVTQ